ncbi:ABC transporter permease [Brevibacterium oceani]|uniref:ABC transporter permease n=1 Tax=Brevibacterium oceani TaxID=358099 RepID=UPI001B3237A8|nr:ABC transporter permease [Brevibacterium oceani]
MSDASPTAVVATGTSTRTRAEKLARLTQRNGALVILLGLVIASALAYPSFASVGNLSQIALQAAFLAPLALGLTFVIFTGGIDLSVGSVFALGGVLAAWASQYGFLAALLVPLLVCTLIGLIQGAIVAFTAIPSFIVTLAGLLFARGLLLALTAEGSQTYKVPAEAAFLQLSRGSFLGLGFPVWIVLILFAVGVIVLHRTSYGSTLLAIGGQPDAARLMGLPVLRSTLIVFSVSGTMAGLAGALTASYTASGVTTLGVGLELTAIAAVVLGGTLLTGGAGTVVGSLVGVVLLQVVANLINRMGLTNSNWQAVVNGAVLLIVAVAQVLLSRVQAKERARRRGGETETDATAENPAPTGPTTPRD